MRDQELTWKVIGCAMRVHTALGPGFLESVYEHALVHEMEKAEIAVAEQQGIDVYYDGIVVGHFVADICVPNRLIIELKAVHTLSPGHEMQLVNYLQATGIPNGLLLNFGAGSLEFKRKYRDYQKKDEQD